jgi:hypothetical protein
MGTILGHSIQLPFIQLIFLTCIIKWPLTSFSALNVEVFQETLPEKLCRRTDLLEHMSSPPSELRSFSGTLDFISLIIIVEASRFVPSSSILHRCNHFNEYFYISYFKCRWEEKKKDWSWSSRHRQSVHGKIILKVVLKEQNMRMWTGFFWLRIGYSGACSCEHGN